MDKKYYIVKNKYLAYGVNYITGQRYYVYKDDKSNKETYSFEDTKEFREAYNKMINLQKRLNVNIN